MNNKKERSPDIQQTITDENEPEAKSVDLETRENHKLAAFYSTPDVE